MIGNYGAAARLGAVTGLKVAAIGSVIYLLVFTGWYLVSEFATDPNLVAGALLTVVVGGVVGVLPAAVAGLLTGGSLGLVLRRWSDRPRPLLGALAGILLAGVVVTVVVVIVYAATSLGPNLLLPLVGLPSVIYVVGFAWIGVWLQNRLARAGRPGRWQRPDDQPGYRPHPGG
ncbi:MAG TPA: hypothetical protein VE617_05830 [Propionibacteriaceae bacterium]|jgi:hypothetical protein|nr:hypothetical protein [Propionibacteriaceae bacterium]